MKIKIIQPDDKKVLTCRMEILPASIFVLEYLAGLTPEGVDIKLINVPMGDEINYEEPADLVAITVRTPMAVSAYEIADEFRKRKITVVLGGPHPTLLPMEAILHADTVCMGEAEEIWPVLIDDFQRGKMKRFYVAGPFDSESLPGPIYHVPSRPGLKGLPYPRRDLSPPGKYIMDSIITTKGCYYDCKFCADKTLYGGKIRHRPIDEVIEEVASLKKEYFFMAENNVLGLPGDTQYYVDLFNEMAKMDEKKMWVGADNLSTVKTKEGRKVLKAAADSGLIYAVVGFETLNFKSATNLGVLEKIGCLNSDNLSYEEQKEAVRIYEDHGVLIDGHFIIGLDEDNMDTYKRILEFCDETCITPIFMILAPMPGTKYYEEYLKEGRFLPNLDWNDFGSGTVILKHPTLSKEEIEEAFIRLGREAYSPENILKRLNHAIKINPGVFYFYSGAQLGIAKAYLNPYKEDSGEDKG